MKDNIFQNKLWNKDFILFFISVFQGSFGASISAVALSFLILKHSHLASAMSITLALQFIPSIFTPFIGTYIDRIKLKLPLVMSNFLRGFVLIGLYVWIALGFFNIYVFYGCSLLNGFLLAIYIPASQSLIPNLIPQNQLVRGNSLLAMANRGMSLIGLICGGIIVSILGPELSIFIEGICYVIASLLLFFISIPSVINLGQKQSFYADLILGIKFTRSSNLILMIILTYFLINSLLSPLGVLLPIHMTKIGKGAFGYGLFSAFIAGGVLFSNFIISLFGEKFKCLPNIVLGWFLISIALAGLGILNSLYFSLCWAILLGISTAMLNTGTAVLLQTIVPVEFRGRVFGTISSICQIGMPLSLFALSFVVTKVTLKEIFLLGMWLAVIFAVIWLIFITRENKADERLTKNLAFELGENK